jgi:hypothetical protein
VWLAESLRRRGARRGASDCAALGSNRRTTLGCCTTLVRTLPKFEFIKKLLFFCFRVYSRTNQHHTLYLYGLGKVDTTSGSEHTTRQYRTEVKPDGAREIRWGEGAGVALCGCGRPLSGDGRGAGGTGIYKVSRTCDPRKPRCVVSGYAWAPSSSTK